MEYLIGGFIILLIIGAIGGGKSFGEVIVSGIVGIIILAVIFGVIASCAEEEKKAEREREREKQELLEQQERDRVAMEEKIEEEKRAMEEKMQQEKEEMEKKLEREKQETLENLSTEDKSSTDTTYIYFNSYCNKDISLYIHYLTPEGYWKTNGKWSFSPYESSFLSDSSERIKTKNAILFYAVEGDDINFDGKIKIGDKYMKKFVDRENNTEIKYSCS
ncbi:MAG: hypothetical protein KGV51_05505 [Moraxellaceae bacterium]|nr:hypothetical protein [Moraxellaceae bacterium]